MQGARMTNFLEWVKQSGGEIKKANLRAVQVNVGYRCNLECTHCHVQAGPQRSECMDLTVMTDVLDFIDRVKVTEVDITGGAPETNAHLLHFIRELRQRDFVERIIVRTNLAIYTEPAYSHLPDELYQLGVNLVASMPCYLEDNVDTQRGNAVFKRNIRILQQLNNIGFGLEKGGPSLHLVYNPGGAFLPAPQAELEAVYREQLFNAYGIKFNKLYTITNMPLGRFAKQLKAEGTLDAYMELLQQNSNADNLGAVMCRDTLNVDWQGRLYDCDFNQVLGLSSLTADNYIGRIKRDDLIDMPVVVGDHCFGCTAGSGSSCGGSLLSQTA